ncbi:helix-turn-helix domain-containing protein [Nitrosospira briensis]|uniref:helix-turn-helix domain-containing protein n=1 Tax=Nitrosospira briensis TaxID=35799 RepID=UPI00055EEAE7|nr:helix-turn-helix domain-containing protein [Nitrosospira briensis]
MGKTPLSYFQYLRVERAVHLLRTSSDSIDLVANQVGYANRVTLRTLLRRRIGRSVSELRAGGLFHYSHIDKHSFALIFQYGLILK